MTEQELISYLIVKINEEDKRLKVGFIGEIGSGKTTFIRRFLSKIDPDSGHFVQSPTYTILNQYEVNRMHVDHYDLYRLETEDELYQIEIMEHLDSKNNLVMVEWIDLFPVLYPYFDFFIKIDLKENESRYYEIISKEEHERLSTKLKF
ncbi:MAG: tRNA (adenosine(37)-N6)-threonylcarbamoyltransferase complex ATPase subunit type 1 TsaE [Deltaproteobacteria bacterium]|nr:tRNA (adenosine(37)-N6)-threonylcarbamoyltransferase complex ATPase subunit type 1 TsaE [Deltaproteobacteria bacterium]